MAGSQDRKLITDWATSAKKGTMFVKNVKEAGKGVILPRKGGYAGCKDINGENIVDEGSPTASPTLSKERRPAMSRLIENGFLMLNLRHGR